MIYYLKHNLHKLNWAMIGNVLGMVLIAASLPNGFTGHCGFDLSRGIV